MNMNPGGAQSKVMMDAHFRRADGTEVTQKMTFQLGDALLFDFSIKVEPQSAIAAGLVRADEMAAAEEQRLAGLAAAAAAAAIKEAAASPPAAAAAGSSAAAQDPRPKAAAVKPKRKRKPVPLTVTVQYRVGECVSDSDPRLKVRARRCVRALCLIGARAVQLLIGVPKGVRQVLMERGQWTGKLKLDCGAGARRHRASTARLAAHGAR